MIPQEFLDDYPDYTWYKTKEEAELVMVVLGGPIDGFCPLAKRACYEDCIALNKPMATPTEYDSIIYYGALKMITPSCKSPLITGHITMETF